MTFKPPFRIALCIAGISLVALVPPALAGKPASGSTRSGCSTSPSQAVLDQVWTVSAWGLPSSTVNLIVTFPNGAQSIGTITVASDGSFTTTGNSNMSATWGFITPEQKGIYTYQFVNRIKWPEGTFTQSYATCSVTVS